MIKINNGFYIKCSIHLLLKQDRNERVMNLKYQIAPTFKGGTFISYDPGSVHCRFVQIFDKDLKCLIYLGYWRTKH